MQSTLPLPALALLGACTLVHSSSPGQAQDRPPQERREAGSFDPTTAYLRLCSRCHGVRRYGGYAPPLIPKTLTRKKDEALTKAILEGLPSTQMPAFGEELSSEQARALVALFREPTPEITWSLEDVAASRLMEPRRAGRLPRSVDRGNLVLVVERGTGQVVVLDGDDLSEKDRFDVGRIHGGLKFDRALRRALAVTRDGTLVDYDLVKGAPRARAKVGVNTRNIAVSSNGAFIVAANQLPQSLVVLDGELNPLSVLALPGQPTAVYQVPGEERFLLTLRDLPHLYFLSYPDLQLRRFIVPATFEDFVFVPGRESLVASSRAGEQLLLYDYGQGALLGSIETEGLPHLFSASYFMRNGRLHAAFNHMEVPRLSIIDMETFEVAKQIPLNGSGYFTRTHAGTPYLWIDSNTESIQLVDKASLKVLETELVPTPGKKAMHVEFTSDGSRALVSIWNAEGAVVSYDSTTLEEQLRIPYRMPVGKYNASNKTKGLRERR